MTRTEERLTDALAARADAVAVGSIRPLPAAGAGRFRRHLVSRRWSVSIAPLAAAGSIATIAAVAMLPQHHQPRPELTGMPRNSELLAVAATSASSAWAVGTILSRRGQPLIMRLDGKTWKRSPIARPAACGMLYAVAAVSARSAWAVGSAGRGPEVRPYILRWNGTIWRPVPTPPMSAPALLKGIVAVSARNAWAVGTTGSHSLILHWNGVRWIRLDGPRVGTSPNRCTASPMTFRPRWCPYSVGLAGLGRTRREELMVTATTLALAQAGDGDASRELIDPYRRKSQLHCYPDTRLGSGRRAHAAGNAAGRKCVP